WKSGSDVRRCCIGFTRPTGCVFLRRCPCHGARLPVKQDCKLGHCDRHSCCAERRSQAADNVDSRIANDAGTDDMLCRRVRAVLVLRHRL
ncbi:hypothetical protein H4S06_004083, partial [Coemansia sp. BCRC 34490]